LLLLSTRVDTLQILWRNLPVTIESPKEFSNKHPPKCAFYFFPFLNCQSKTWSPLSIHIWKSPKNHRISCSSKVSSSGPCVKRIVDCLLACFFLPFSLLLAPENCSHEPRCGKPA
jgi:hypothetical protein